MNFKKNHDRHYIKTIETNNTTEDKTKSKSSIIVNNPKNQLPLKNKDLPQTHYSQQYFITRTYFFCFNLTFNFFSFFFSFNF